MIPFGYTFEKMRSTPGQGNIHEPFEVAWGFIRRIFPAFSVNWLARTKPDAHNEQAKLLTLAIIALPELALVETSRQVGFISGCFVETQNLDTSTMLKSKRSKELYEEVWFPLLENVWKDWKIPVRD